MDILDWSTLDEAGRQDALARPRSDAGPDAERIAREAIARVRADGDRAVRALTREFDAVSLESLEVTPEEWAAAPERVGPRGLECLTRTIANVKRFHEAQGPRPLRMETEPGVLCEQVIRPITTVGLYVPAGTAPLPSTVIMLAVPARIAGCAQRLLCTPPRADGTAHPAVLAAAQLCGIDSVFKVGGAQAIAALAYGTETVPRADKIFGPGNAYVAAAKRLVAQDPEGTPCDLPAGPSEVMVIADETARADFVAADLLAQAEHDCEAQAILVTDSRALAEEVVAELHLQRRELPRSAILNASLDACRSIVVADLEAALEIANDYAPEHLILHTLEPRRWLPKVKSAGSVFLGPWSAETFGDYCSGTNHVLPTGGAARAWGGLSVRDFVKVITVQELSPSAVRSLGPTAITLAGLEGLQAHANAISRRLKLLDAERADRAAGVAP